MWDESADPARWAVHNALPEFDMKAAAKTGTDDAIGIEMPPENDIKINTIKSALDGKTRHKTAHSTHSVNNINGSFKQPKSCVDNSKTGLLT